MLFKNYCALAGVTKFRLSVSMIRPQLCSFVVGSSILRSRATAYCLYYSSRNIHTSNSLLEDFYKVLGVTRNATQKEIKSAYFIVSTEQIYWVCSSSYFKYCWKS